MIETVYGLGANALNRDAVCDIFKAKNRPFNGAHPFICPIVDPVIVHVLSEEDAERYIDVCEEVIPKTRFSYLGTQRISCSCNLLLARSIDCCNESQRYSSERTYSLIPKSDVGSAGTGKVGFRCPKQPLARELLRIVMIWLCVHSSRVYPLQLHQRTNLAIFPLPALNMCTTTYQIGQSRLLMGAKCSTSVCLLSVVSVKSESKVQ